MSRHSRGRDPYWTNARLNSTDANGNTVKRGDRIFYYRLGRSADYCGLFTKFESIN